MGAPNVCFACVRVSQRRRLYVFLSSWVEGVGEVCRKPGWNDFHTDGQNSATRN